MYRFHFVILAGLASSVLAHSGQIQIGGVNGLTAAYIAGGSGSTTGWVERNYTNALFENATITPAAGQTNALPLQTGATAGVNSMTDANGIVFSMLNDGNLNGTLTNNAWTSNTSGVHSITVPVNVFGVQNVYIMLDDFYGYAGENATVVFNFASGADTITLADLANGTGAIRSATDCTGGTISCPPATTVTGSHTVSASLPSTSNTNTSGDATIITSAIWKGTYTVAPSATTTPYNNSTSGSSGTVALDELAFSFSSNHTNTTLNSITITTDAGNLVGNSRLALSAITLTATPEPSTMVLFGAGLGLLSWARRRRSA